MTSPDRFEKKAKEIEKHITDALREFVEKVMEEILGKDDGK